MHAVSVSNAAPPDVEARTRAAVAPHRGLRGPLLPVLHAVQAEFGWIPAEAVPVVADELNLSRADVHGVVTFYADFRREPAGRSTVRLCRAEACQAVGAQALVEAVEARFAVKVGATSADGEVTLEEVFCLGNCALGPSASVDGAVVGRASVQRLGALVAAAGAGRTPPGQGEGAS
jgi:formate dehydrogenase subunit gamma